MNLFNAERNIWIAFTAGGFGFVLLFFLHLQYAALTHKSRIFHVLVLTGTLSALLEGVVRIFTVQPVLLALIRIPVVVLAVVYGWAEWKENHRKRALLLILIVSCLTFIWSFQKDGEAVQMIFAVGIYALFMTSESRDFKKIEKMQRETEERTRQAEKETARRNSLFRKVYEEMIQPLEVVSEDVGKLERLSEEGSQQKDLVIQMDAVQDLLDYLMKDILDMVSLGQEGLTLNERRFHISDVIGDLEFMMQAQAEAKGLQFRCIPDPNLPEIWSGDDVRLRQILINLCQNGIRETEKGCVSLYASENKEGKLLFVISDSGKGIPKEDLKHLFEENEKENSQTSFLHTGTGLLVAGGLVKKMQGSMHAESVVGRGTKLIVSLSMKEGEKIAETGKFLDTSRGIFFYDNSEAEYRQVLRILLAHTKEARKALETGEEKKIASMCSIASGIGAMALHDSLSSHLRHQAEGKIINEKERDELMSIFDETMYRIKGYAGRR